MPGAATGVLELQDDQTRSAAVPMAAYKPGIMELTEQNFAPSIDGHPFAVVEFWAPSSAPSRASAQTFAAAPARHPDVLFATVNIEDQQAIRKQFDIRSTPALMIFRNNIIVYAKAAPHDAKALDDAVGAARALDMEQVRRKVARVDAVTLGAPIAPSSNVSMQAAAEASTLSIETCLRQSLRGPRSALMDVGPRLAAGGLIEIRNAFEPDFAEQMYRSLDSCTTWRLYENYEKDFSYHHHNLFNPDQYPAALSFCSKIFDSSSTKAWVTRLSGRPCLGPAEVYASWYLPGDHSLPHNDASDSGANLNRQVAYVWHLAKDWRSEWGGALYWCPTASYLPPAFNTLWLFNVGPESAHFVTRVSPYAHGKRLAINGWWTGPGATGDPVWTGPDRIGSDDGEILIY
jgi:Rps23 Pro-64 3,4-dihydroxylase Tpa1-like proline 4-hydroxylase/thiol-disulfide isomerase/thioredoxin